MQGTAVRFLVMTKPAGYPEPLVHPLIRRTCFPHLLLPLFIGGRRTEKMSGKWKKEANSDG